MQNKLNQK